MGPNNNRTTERGAVAALLALVIAVASIAACAPTAPRLDLTQVQRCPGESGPGMTGPVPCVWDSEVQGLHPGGSPRRWYLYANTCPVNTVQDHRLVECIGRADWTGGIEGEGRTN
jgi:hypothetical protein